MTLHDTRLTRRVHSRSSTRTSASMRDIWLQKSWDRVPTVSCGTIDSILKTKRKQVADGQQRRTVPTQPVRVGRHQEDYKCLQQAYPRKARAERNQAAGPLQRCVVNTHSSRLTKTLTLSRTQKRTQRQTCIYSLLMLTCTIQITCLYDMDIVGDPRAYNEVYLYEELMECDLAAIIRYSRNTTLESTTDKS